MENGGLDRAFELPLISAASGRGMFRPCIPGRPVCCSFGQHTAKRALPAAIGARRSENAAPNTQATPAKRRWVKGFSPCVFVGNEIE